MQFYLKGIELLARYQEIQGTAKIIEDLWFLKVSICYRL
jgi:hypothetical protein